MTPAAECRERARTWANSDERLAGALVHGSIAHGTDNAFSDIDLVLVARTGERASLWEERRSVAEHVLGGDIVWAQELPWQRPSRFQAWRDDLVMVDLTLDEGRAEPWQGLLGPVEVPPPIMPSESWAKKT